MKKIPWNIILFAMKESNKDIQIILSSENLSIDIHYEFLRNDDCGAICFFIGNIRNNNFDKEVKKVHMEAYSPMVKLELERIISEAMKKWELHKVSVAHRYGDLSIGDIAVIIGVVSEHRKNVFEATQYVIDELKKSVPIWKNEFYLDGSNWQVPHP